MKEEWRDIEGYEGAYQVSNIGRVRSLDRVVRGKGNSENYLRGKMKKLTVDRDGYLA